MVALGAPARAQVLGYEEVRNCVCYEEQLSHWRSESDLRGGIMREKDAEFQRAKQQLAQAQATANPNSEADLDRVRMMIEQVGQMRIALQNQIVPGFNQSVAQVNSIVARYNQQCAGYTLFVELVNRAKAAGPCPMQ